MSEEKDDKPPKVWVALPNYNKTAAVLTMKSVVTDVFHLVRAGLMVRIFDELGHADIYLLRAQIVANFLADPDATDLVMVDCDVGWPEGGLLRLLAHDCDVVAGVYPKRELSPDGKVTFIYRSAGGALSGDMESGLFEVWGVPGGFMRIKRHVLEKMVAHYGPELTAYDAMVPGGKTCRLFDPYWFEDAKDGCRRVLSEDYAFCQRWRDMGGQVFMDVNIPMAHIGTHAFQGCLGDWLQAKGEEQQFKAEELLIKGEEKAA